MLEVIFLIVLGLIWITFASIQDIRKKEVANWLNFSLIIFALGFRFFYSLFSESAGGSFMFFYQGLIGLGIFLVLGNLLYHMRMFAGGDAKMMIALGAVLPFTENFFINLQIFALFLILFLFSGMFYGLIWSLVLAMKHIKSFRVEFMKQFNSLGKFIYPLKIFGLIVMGFGFFESMFFGIGVLIFLLPSFYLYAKTIEEVCMIKKVATKDLVEGDWLYKNVKVGRKTIKANWEGLSTKEIALLRKNYKNVLVKHGIPFVPVFLISFICLIFLWYSNWQPHLFFFF